MCGYTKAEEIKRAFLSSEQSSKINLSGIRGLFFCSSASCLAGSSPVADSGNVPRFSRQWRLVLRTVRLINFLFVSSGFVNEVGSAHHSGVSFLASIVVRTFAAGHHAERVSAQRSHSVLNVHKTGICIRRTFFGPILELWESNVPCFKTFAASVVHSEVFIVFIRCCSLFYLIFFCKIPAVTLSLNRKHATSTVSKIELKLVFYRHHQ